MVHIMTKGSNHHRKHAGVVEVQMYFNIAKKDSEDPHDFKTMIKVVKRVFLFNTAREREGE